MEYIIILVLLIFLLILIFKNQLQLQLQFLKDSLLNKKNKKISNNKSNVIEYNILFSNNNTFLLYLYEKLYISLKKCNRYNYKKYIIFNDVNLSEKDKSILDWCSFTGGIINMVFDSSIKNIKQKKTIDENLINNIAKLKLFYKMFYILDENKLDKIIKMKKYTKYTKYIKYNRFIYNLVYINEVLIIIYNNIVKTINDYSIKKVLNKNNLNKNINNYYLCNIFLNNKIRNNNKKIYESIFKKYIMNIL